MKIGLVILTRNEIQGVTAVVPKIPRSAVDEIFAVDGQSKDGTKEFLEGQGIRVLTQEKMGRGEAFRLAAEKTTSDALIFYSPDGNEDPADIPTFRTHLERGADIVIASRMMRGAHNEEDGKLIPLRKWVNQLFTLCINLLWNRSDRYVTDTINGFRAVTVGAFRRLAPDGSGYTIEFQSSIRAMKQGLRVVEFPTHESARIGPGGSPSFATGVAFIKCLLREMRLSLGHFFRDHRIMIGVLGGVYILASLYLLLIDPTVFIDHGYPIHGGGDSYHYALLTENLAAGHGFSISEAAPYVQDMLRSPGYPWFLLPLYFVDHSFVLAIVVQIALVIGSALLIQAIGRKFLPAFWASAVAYAYALDPTTIFYSLSLWSDTLFSFLLLASVWLLFVRPPRTIVGGVIPGLLLALAAYVRPAGGYLVWILGVALLVTLMGRVGWKKAVVTAVVMMVTYGALLLPWSFRNHEIGGVYALSSIGPYTLLLYDVHDFLISKGQSPERVTAELATQLPPTETELRSGHTMALMSTLAKRYIAEDPVGYALFHGMGSLNLFLASSIRDAANNLPGMHRTLERLHLMSDNSVNLKSLAKRNPVGAVIYSVRAEPLLTLERLFRLATVILMVVAFVFALLKRRARAFVIIACLVAAYTALVIGPVSYPRYRISAEPFIFLAAAAGAVALLQRRTLQ